MTRHPINQPTNHNSSATSHDERHGGFYNAVQICHCQVRQAIPCLLVQPQNAQPSSVRFSLSLPSLRLVLFTNPRIETAFHPKHCVAPIA